MSSTECFGSHFLKSRASRRNKGWMFLISGGVTDRLQRLQKVIGKGNFAYGTFKNYHSPIMISSYALNQPHVFLSIYRNNQQYPNRKAVELTNLSQAARGTFRDFHQISLFSFHCVRWPLSWHFSPLTQQIRAIWYSDNAEQLRSAGTINRPITHLD